MPVNEFHLFLLTHVFMLIGTERDESYGEFKWIKSAKVH